MAVEVPRRPADPAVSEIRVMIVDDHEILSASLAHVIDEQPELRTVAVARDVATAVRIIAEARPDVVILDHRLPDGDGVAAIPRLRERSPQAAYVVLTASTAEHVLVGAIEAGAAGFVSKTRGLQELNAAVRAAAAGESVISPELLARLLPRLQRGSVAGPHELTDRERQVLGLLAEGRSNAAIADHLGVSVHTVRNHVAKLSAKLGAHSKLEVLAIAVREGLLPGP